MIRSEPHIVCGRNEVKGGLSIYTISWLGLLREKLGHIIKCKLLGGFLLKPISGWHVYQLGGEDWGKAPLYVWFDLHCPANMQTHRKRVASFDLTDEQYAKLGCDPSTLERWRGERGLQGFLGKSGDNE